MSADGAHIRTIGSQGSGPGQFCTPTGVAVDGGGNIVVAEFGNNRVQVLTADGRHVRTLGGAGSAPGQFCNPYGVAVDVDGCIIVADYSNNRVQMM